MYNYGYDENAIVNLRDSLNGIVRYQDYNGNLHIDLEIEDDTNKDHFSVIPAFGYWTGKVKPRTAVVCSLRRFAKENRDIQVNIDSVKYEEEKVA